MKYNSIKRLYEADDIQQMPAQPAPGMAAPTQVQPQPGMDVPMETPQPAATSMEEMPNFSDSQPMQQALPEADVMNLTVKELIERCQKINPLVCMGLEKFIEENKEEILAMTTGEDQSALDDTTDLTFSKQVEPQPAEFSLDQPATDLNFPA
jgi:phosphoribosyl-ATP pyrophosphohydrolase